MRVLLVSLLMISTAFVEPKASSSEVNAGCIFLLDDFQQDQKPPKRPIKREPPPTPKPNPTPPPATPRVPPNYANPPANGNDTGGPSNEMSYSTLTGTYSLDISRSDDANEVAASATRRLPNSDRQGVYEQLVDHLESPVMLAIEQQERRVTIASSREDKVSVDIDGRDRTERTGDGQMVMMGAELRGKRLVITSRGNKSGGSSVTYYLMDNGRSLRVTRRVSAEQLDRRVKVESVYNRISELAQWDIYQRGNEYPRRPIETSSSVFIVPDGTRLVAVLDNTLSTGQSREGDRFTMTVGDPERYEGATIEGHISNLEGGEHANGRSGMTFNLDRIRLHGGRTYRFSAIIRSIRTPKGETIQVSGEDGDSGRDRVKSKPARDIGRSGAIIGAIAGGAKGANMGAALGTSAGAIYIPGRGGFELTSGSEVTMQVISPR